MTTAAMHLSQAGTVNTASRRVANSQSSLSMAGWFGVIKSTLAMAHAVPQTGRVSARQMETLRAMAAEI